MQTPFVLADDLAKVSVHPVADFLPVMADDEYAELVEDVRERGLIEPILVIAPDGLAGDIQIVDGRHRFRAAQESGVDPVFVLVEGATDPVSLLRLVISKNLKRRHLNQQQRAMLAAEMNRQLAVGLSESASAVNVPLRTAERAAAVAAHGAQEVVDAVKTGEASLLAAEEISRRPIDEQKAIIMEIAKSPDTAKAFSQAAKALRGEKQKDKAARREAKVRDLSAKVRALPDKTYMVIVADPEWEFKGYSLETGMDRAAANHYPTSSVEEIMQRGVPAIAAPDSVLFLWAIAPMLPEALRVVEAWGFIYKTHRIWRKVRPGKGRGQGYWFTGEHEILIVATRGNLPAPSTAAGPSVFDAPVGEHSEKPAAALIDIEAMFVDAPRIELNCRDPRPGWDAWGDVGSLIWQPDRNGWLDADGEFRSALKLAEPPAPRPGKRVDVSRFVNSSVDTLDPETRRMLDEDRIGLAALDAGRRIGEDLLRRFVHLGYISPGHVMMDAGRERLAHLREALE